MAIGDYLETNDDRATQKAKKAFVDYIVGLEQTLDDAASAGKAGDIRMLETLGELQDVDTELEYYAVRANELVPMRKYHIEIGKLVREYLPVILKKEMADIESALTENPDAVGEATSRLNQIENIISFYRGLYPELKLEAWEEKIKSITARFVETAE